MLHNKIEFLLDVLARRTVLILYYLTKFPVEGEAATCDICRAEVDERVRDDSLRVEALDFLNMDVLGEFPFDVIVV